MRILTSIPLEINTYTASTTLSLLDAGKLILMNGGTTNDITVPLNSVVAFPIGTQIVIIQKSSIKTNFTPIGGVTINSDSSKLSITSQYCGATLIKTATNVWNLIGNLSA